MSQEWMKLPFEAMSPMFVKCKFDPVFSRNSLGLAVRHIQISYDLESAGVQFCLRFLLDSMIVK